MNPEDFNNPDLFMSKEEALRRLEELKNLPPTEVIKNPDGSVIVLNHRRGIIKFTKTVRHKK